MGGIFMNELGIDGIVSVPATASEAWRGGPFPHGRTEAGISRPAAESGFWHFQRGPDAAPRHAGGSGLAASVGRNPRMAVVAHEDVESRATHTRRR